MRDERDFGPAHFALKIESYSLLSNAPNGHGKRYESGIFDVEGYKWYVEMLRAFSFSFSFFK